MFAKSPSVTRSTSARRARLETLESRCLLAITAVDSVIDDSQGFDQELVPYVSQPLEGDALVDLGSAEGRSSSDDRFDSYVPMPLPTIESGDYAQGSSSGQALPVSYNSATGETSIGSANQHLEAITSDWLSESGNSYGPLDGEIDGGDAAADFTSLSRVFDPETKHFKSNVKVFMSFPEGNFVCSGTLIDPRHVLTAGHCVYSRDSNAWASSIDVVPAYEDGAEPFGRSSMVEMHTWTPWINSGDFDHDVGVIDLDRPVGALTDSYGYGFNDNANFFTGNTFHNPGYPAASPFDGQFMYYWFGDFDSTDYSGGAWQGQELTINSESFGGQSGSGAYYKDANDDRFVYAVLSNGNSTSTNFARLTSDKFSLIRDSFIADDVPSAVDLIPLNVDLSSSSATAGQQLSNFDYKLHNYSSTTWSGSVDVQVYLSTNDNISTSDTLLQTRVYTGTIGPKSTRTINATSSLPTIPAGMSSGNYWVGVILDVNDFDTNNNDTDDFDAAAVSISAAPQLPDLRPNQRSGWDDTLVVATTTGTTTSASTIYNDQTIYVDYGVINSGNAAAGSFRYGLYVDGARRKFVERNSLGAGSTSWVDDSDLGQLSAGSHTIEIRADYDSEVSESNESNNIYSRTIVVQQRQNNARIQGTKWNDLDGDSTRDAGEPGLAGWTIYLDLNNNGQLNGGEPSRVTDGSGNYEFTGLAAGTYNVREVMQTGWTQTFPDTHNDSSADDATEASIPSDDSHHFHLDAPGPDEPVFLIDDDLPVFPDKWLGEFYTEARTSGGDHTANPLTLILDFNDPGQANTTDGLGSTVSTFDVTDYGFSAGQYNQVTNAVLGVVRDHYLEIATSAEFGPSPIPAGQELAMEIEIGNIGTPPANGSNDYYYLQIGTRVSSPACPSALGCASISAMRNSSGNAQAAVGSVVGSVFTDAIQGIGGLSPSNALGSGNLALTSNAIGGTATHEAAHSLSLRHLDKAGSVTPHGLPPVMGTGAIDLPNQDRINNREFALSGTNEQMGGVQQFHIQQLVGAIGLHDDTSIPAGTHRVTVAAGQTASGISFGNQQVSPPSSPEPLNVTVVSTTQVNLSWNNANHETSYEIYISQGSGSSSLTTVGANVTSYSVTGLTPNAFYRFLIVAKNSAGSAAGTWTDVVTTFARPSSPEPLTATVASTTQVSLSWNDAQQETGYVIYVSQGNGSSVLATVGRNVTNYNVNGLNPNGFYRFLVVARNQNGGTAGTWRDVVTSAAKPNAPHPLNVAVTSTSQVTLSWNDSQRETSYVIYVSQGNGSSVLATVGRNVTTYQVNGLNPDGFYRFLIVARNQNGGTAGSWKDVVMTSSKPNAPNPLTVTVTSNTQATLSWDNSPRETGYVIYVSQGNGSSVLATVGRNVTTYNATGLNSNGFYRFLIVARNQNGGTASTWRDVVMTSAKPTSPNPLIATVTSPTQVRLNWKNSQLETNYAIYVSQGSGSSFLTTTGRNANSYTVSGLTPNSFYRFLIVARNQNGATAGTWQDVTTSLVPPTSPDPLVATPISSSQVRLNWNDAQNETSYAIYGSQGSGSYFVATTQGGTSQFVVNGLTPGFNRFLVVARNSIGNTDGTWTDVIVPAASPDTPAAAPAAPNTLVATAVSHDTVELNWNDVANETGYVIYESRGSGSYSIASVPANSTSYTLRGVRPSETLRYLVVASNGRRTANGNWFDVDLVDHLLDDPSWLDRVR